MNPAPAAVKALIRYAMFCAAIVSLCAAATFIGIGAHRIYLIASAGS